MCECKTRIEKLLTEHYAAQKPDDKNHSATLTGYGIRFTHDGAMSESMFMPASLQSTTTVKRTGAQKHVTTKIDMHFSHCPFCGEKQT